MIIAAQLLIGFKCDAQSKESDRSWIDSLEVKYRTAFIQSAISRDHVVLDSMRKSVDKLIFNLQATRNYDKRTKDELIDAILQYDYERRAQHLRRCAYMQEIHSARTDFGY